MLFKCRVLAVVFILCASSRMVFAEVIILDASDRGTYTMAGTHFPDNLDYSVGDSAFNGDLDDLHNWFLFDLSSITQTIISAELHLDNTSYASADPFETFVLHNVTTNLGDLISGLGGVPAFNDLGSGAFYGDYNATTADIFSTITINLNTAALTDLNAVLGGVGMWATGGSITTLDADPFNNENIFSLTGGLPLSSTRLVITTIPSAPGLPILLTLMFWENKRRRGSMS